ncbi:CsgG/HfaB family protein [Bacteroidota bacterium]
MVDNLQKKSFFTLIIGLLCIFIVQNIYGQDDAATRLAEAEKYYKSAFFDKAIEILADLSQDVTIDSEVRKESLRFLGRAYVAKGLYDKAKDAILKLLELEPPLIALNPDYEPPPLMKVYYDARKTKTGSYTVERPDPGMKTMAIIDFKNRSIDQKEKFDPMEKGFSDLIIHRLNNATDLKVIERDRINWILNEIEIQDKHSMEGAVRMGKQLGVHSVLLGSFIIYEDEMWLGARLVKVETSEILLTDEIKGEVDEFYDLTDKLSEKIAAKIEVNIGEADEGLAAATESLEALLSYSEGLAYLETGDYKQAYKKFIEALEFDPEYENAKVKAESIKPFAG